MATVSGPTPPGTGVMAEAMSFTAVEVHIAHRLVSYPVDAHIKDNRSGPDHLLLDQGRNACCNYQYLSVSGVLEPDPW